MINSNTTAVKKFYGVTVNTFKTATDSHAKYKEYSALFKKHGVTDMWSYTHPETGDKIMYLEKDGELIQKFNLKHELQEARNYFNKINAPKISQLKANFNKKIYLSLFGKPSKEQQENLEKLSTQLDTIEMKEVGVPPFSKKTSYIFDDETYDDLTDAKFAAMSKLQDLGWCTKLSDFYNINIRKIRDCDGFTWTYYNVGDKCFKENEEREAWQYGKRKLAELFVLNKQKHTKYERRLY